MPFNCNIDRRGRTFRALLGMVLLLLAAAGMMLWFPQPNWLLALAAGLFAGAGLFCLFEALAGWCGLRALGFKTRI